MAPHWDVTPFPFLAPWPSRPPAIVMIETPPRPVPPGPLISWPRNASCSRIPSRASRASPPPRRWAPRQHAVGSHYAPALRLYLAACSPSSNYHFLVLDHFCSSLPQLFHFCQITETWSLNLCVLFTFSFSASAFLIEMDFSFKSLFAIWSLSPQQFHYYFYLSIVLGSIRNLQPFWCLCCAFR